MFTDLLRLLLHDLFLREQRKPFRSFLLHAFFFQLGYGCFDKKSRQVFMCRGLLQALAQRKLCRLRLFSGFLKKLLPAVVSLGRTH